MTRSELITRLTLIRYSRYWQEKLDKLIEDINADGVLDVQCSSQIAEQLPRESAPKNLQRFLPDASGKLKW